MKIDAITIDKSAFDILKEALGDKIKDKCDFCEEKITKDNFGYISKDITSCKNIFCLTQAVKEE